MRRFRRWILIIIFVLCAFAFVHFIGGYSYYKDPSAKMKHSIFKPNVLPELDVQNSFGLIKISPKLVCPAPLKKASADINTKTLWKELMGGLTPPRESAHSGDTKYATDKISINSKLLVFVVPHSHVDPGWLQTVDEYTRSTTQILTNMVQYLSEHPDMTFTWMETCFFSQWWSNLTVDQKHKVKSFVREGQLELTSGSWVMTDEASPYFWSSIDNIIEGHQFLMENFGSVPKVAWSNDPFGYGATVPYLFNLANISRSVIHRVHSAIKANFGNEKDLDFYFRQQWDQTFKHDVFTHILPYSHYDVLNTCGPSPTVCCQFDFKRLTHFSCGGSSPIAITDQNVKQRADLITEQYRLMAELYKKNVLLVMLGDDFRYDMMEEWSQQHDNYAKLFEHINSDQSYNMEIQFGTFTKFFNALASRSDNLSKEKFSSVSGDFFPYHDVSDHYWTGYYTTRPFYKRMDRFVQAMIRSADISSSMAFLLGKRDKLWYSKMFRKLKLARRNLALFQHHDAITGTSKWKVVDDYGQRLYSALVTSSDVTAQSISGLIGSVEEKNLEWNEFANNFKGLFDPKVIVVENEKPISLWIYNSLTFSRYELVTIRVSRFDVVARNSDHSPIECQLNPIILSNGVVVKDYFELLLKVFLPPLGAVQVIIQNDGSKDNSVAHAVVQTLNKFDSVAQNAQLLFPEPFKVEPLPEIISLSNEIFKTYHDSSTGYLKSIQTKNGNFSNILEFWQYTDTSSGAYLFSPHNPPKRWDHNVTSMYIVKGPLKEEIVSFAEGIFHRESVLSSIFDTHQTAINIENIIDIRKDKNTEVVMRLSSNVANENRTFFTDSNGFQLLEREYLRNQPIERNYYPIASSIMLEDDKNRFTVLTGQPHGGTSIDVGVVEIMLDRILVQDDSKGLGYDSIIRDNVPARSNFRLLVEKTVSINEVATPSFDAHQSFQRLLYRPVVFQQMDTSKLNDFTPISANFSCDIQLLNLRGFNLSEFGLILHRIHGSCHESERKVPWCGSEDNGLEQFLELLKIKTKLESCTLSGIKSGTIAKEDMNSLQPMQIKTYCFSVD